jgi:Na+-transporting NADH:ubiquinone oxidoreductase subunit A
MIKLKKGLDLPIGGEPNPSIAYGAETHRVALLADDYPGMKPALVVDEGETVKKGQVLFTDRATPEIQYTAPGCGKVAAIHRGEKRRFESMVIELDGDDEQRFAVHDISVLTGDQARENLLASGLWTALRTRPFNKVPDPGSKPHSIFVTAMDTSPLAADPAPIIAEQSDDFILGLHVLTRLTEGTVFVCYRHGSEVPGKDVPEVRMEAFAGPHPAGLAGTHIHFLDPVSSTKTVWFIGYQDVIACGSLFRTGRLSVDRVVSLAGPSVEKPRLIRTRLGACTDDLVTGELCGGEHRVISGSVLSGRKASPPHNFLGRYDVQISVLEEGRRRELLGWQAPGFGKFSVTWAFASAWLGRGRRFALNTSTHGSKRAMVPIGVYEKVMPLDILPTQLLRALIVGDVEQAQALGCLELDEDDLALCTFVCPGKYDYGPMLRSTLDRIEQEG